MFETGGWSPTGMPRRETEHSLLHPAYDGRPQALNAYRSPLVVEERMAQEQATLAVEVKKAAD